jgi:hypothetical protein
MWIWLLFLFVVLTIVSLCVFFVLVYKDIRKESKKRILFLLLHTQDKEQLKDTIKDTWISHLDSQYEQALFLVCKTEPYQITQPGSDTIILEEDLKDDGVDVVLHKTLFGFRHVLKNYKFDYLVRSNNGTYFQSHILQEYLRENPNLKFGGLVAQTVPKFVSGSCMIFRHDVLERLNTYYEKNFPKESSRCDDVILSRCVIDRFYIEPTHFNRVDIEQLDEIETCRKDEWCYRLSHPYDDNLRIQKFKMLESKIENQKLKKQNK